MSDPKSSLSRTSLVPDHAAAVAILVQPVLDDLVGPGAAPVSLAFEYGTRISPGDSVVVEGRIIRGTRTLIFVQAQVMTNSGQLAADISAVFRRQNLQENPPDRQT